MTNFGQAWQRPPTQGMSERLQGLIKQDPPLKPRVEGAIKGLNQPISKLGRTSNQLSEKETKTFQ